MTRAAQSRLWRWIKGMMLRRMPLMITCTEFEGFILAYLEGELPSRQRRVFEFHLKICRECRDYLAAHPCPVASGRAARGAKDALLGRCRAVAVGVEGGGPSGGQVVDAIFFGDRDRLQQELFDDERAERQALNDLFRNRGQRTGLLRAQARTRPGE